LREGFKDSPLFNGTIKSIGPRYCPSIETKLQTFSDKKSHHLFIEPEGERTNEYYLNGFASSLPWDIQLEALRLIKGFSKIKIYRPGYAIEYDYFSPNQLRHTLESRIISGLYLTGQINGTTGYEEAACQGLMAGINAHQSINNLEPFVLNRDEAYIGVLIDDLIIKGVNEPYRMFTSRAEYRILLRQDNADYRLTKKSFELGLASKKRYDILVEKIEKRDLLIDFIKKLSVKPEQLENFLLKNNSSTLKQGVKLVEVLNRPNISINSLRGVLTNLDDFIKTNNIREEIIEASEILIKYSGYIDRERLIADKMRRLENFKIKDKFNYLELKNLSFEARQKLDKFRPDTIGQASRISGISPADINVLIILLGR